jgi:hypothetical protein
MKQLEDLSRIRVNEAIQGGLKAQRISRQTVDSNRWDSLVRMLLSFFKSDHKQDEALANRDRGRRIRKQQIEVARKRLVGGGLGIERSKD